MPICACCGAVDGILRADGCPDASLTLGPIGDRLSRRGNPWPAGIVGSCVHFARWLMLLSAHRGPQRR